MILKQTIVLDQINFRLQDLNSNLIHGIYTQFLCLKSSLANIHNKYLINTQFIINLIHLIKVLT